jgi:hypothetical protein
MGCCGQSTNSSFLNNSQTKISENSEALTHSLLPEKKVTLNLETDVTVQGTATVLDKVNGVTTTPLTDA